VEDSGAPLEWVWKVVMFTLPLPFTRKQVLMELGPSYAVFVMMVLLSMYKRSTLLLAATFTYQAALVFMMRWLAGTYTHRVAAFYVVLLSSMYYVALA